MTLLCSVCADVWWLSSQHATGRLRSSVSMFLAAALQNLAPRMMTVRMGPRRLMTCRAFPCESRLPTHPPVSVNFVVVAVRIQNALAGVDRPEQDPNGLPLNAAGRFLHVVYRKSGSFGAHVTVRGKTTNLGVCPDARAAAEAVQTLQRAGKVVRLSKSEAAAVAAVRVLQKGWTPTMLLLRPWQASFSACARLLTCTECAAGSSARASRHLVCHPAEWRR